MNLCKPVNVLLFFPTAFYISVINKMDRFYTLFKILNPKVIRRRCKSDLPQWSLLVFGTNLGVHLSRTMYVFFYPINQICWMRRRRHTLKKLVMMNQKRTDKLNSVSYIITFFEYFLCLQWIVYAVIQILPLGLTRALSDTINIVLIMAVKVYNGCELYGYCLTWYFSLCVCHISLHFELY